VPSDPRFNLDREERWEDVWSYRVGYRWQTGGRSEWRVGYIYDESPQPVSSVSPLLPDADRNALTAGYGWSGPRLAADVALMYLAFDTVDVTPAKGQIDGFYGTYETTGWLLGLTLTWR